MSTEQPQLPRLSCQTRKRKTRINTFTKGALLSLSLLSGRAAASGFDNPDLSDPMISNVNSTGNATVGSLSNRTPIKLTITNSCEESIWPGLVTQTGVGPPSHGFELVPGTSRVMFLSSDWAGRVWGRTNCTFNADGTGPRTPEGVNGRGRACLTGDCGGRRNCTGSGENPTTVSEFTFRGGSNNDQTFYDISLVDGYNLPVSIVYHPSSNTSWIPPNLSNIACIASAGYLTPSFFTSTRPSPKSTNLNANASFPMPYESSQTDGTVRAWCPFDLLQYSPPKPGSGVFPYPDDGIPRPNFQPCFSACSATNNPADCCAGEYNSPDVCKPSEYSLRAKRVCPDAYSFAYDDHVSTFVIPWSPAEAAWEVRFCPRGRSTDILRAFPEEIGSIGAGHRLGGDGMQRVMDKGYVEARWRSEGSGRGKVGLGVVMGVVAVVGVMGGMVW
ncbi:thaumatin family protein [Chaetomium sp. MPI-SDFR-AT-0129]|nr:thaumatin family protein [Chaetomium sp. MPI-SDFR-AT-0129]